MADYLLIIGERDALAWVLREQRMAFPGYRRREAVEVAADDRLFLYTTRGCFHNPTTGRGRVIGIAKAVDQPTVLAEPVDVAARRFELGCSIEFVRLARYCEGVELAPLVPQLTTFPNKRGWMTRLRRPLVRLTAEDARLLVKLLRPVSGPPHEAIASYPTSAGRARHLI